MTSLELARACRWTAPLAGGLGGSFLSKPNIEDSSLTHLSAQGTAVSEILHCRGQSFGRRGRVSCRRCEGDLSLR